METFLAVCRLGSYTRAAEELNITQPAVTQHIQHLQTYYGVRLLDYRSKRLTLTPEGELLRRAALTMRHDEEKLKRELADLRQGRRALRFGATLTVGEYLLPPRLAAYLKANPDVELHMTVDNTRNLLQKLNAGELDFAVVEGYFRKSEYDYIVWSLEEFLCVCGADSPLAGAPARPLDALFGETLLLRSPGSGSRDVLERVLEERNHRVEDFGRVVETYAGIPMVDMGSYYNGASTQDVVETTGGKTAIYAVSLGLDGFHGISPVGDGVISSYMPDLTAPGSVKTGAVELVAGVALKNTLKAAVLKDIAIAAE